jgi:hypothetical protein
MKYIRLDLSLGLSFVLCFLVGCGGGAISSDARTASNGSSNSGVTPEDATAARDLVQEAIRTGDASAVALPTMLAATQTYLNTLNTSYTNTRQAVLKLNADNSSTAKTPTGIDWDPGKNSMYFNLLDNSRNMPLLTSNWRYSNSTAGTGLVLGVAGQSVSTQARHAAFGVNPLGAPGNAAMDQYMKNTVDWLTARSQSSDFKIVTAHLPGTNSYAPHEPLVRKWFAKNYPSVSINGQAAANMTTDNTCDGEKLNACLKNADLLVIGRQPGTSGSPTEAYPNAYDGDTILRAVSDAQARGVPVLFLNHYYETNDLSNKLLAYFGLTASMNYFTYEGLKNYGVDNSPVNSNVSTELLTLLNRLDKGSFSTDWSGCVDYVGRLRCEVDNSNTGDVAFTNEFYKPAQNIRTRLRTMDADGLSIFSNPDYTLEKMLILLGDKYREKVSFPMKKETARGDFFKAYFSDVTSYMNRKSNALSINLGNFSKPFPASTPTISQTLTISAPATGNKEVMTGLYVLPGRAVTLTRTDNSASTVKLGVNMLRNTTWLYNNYDRPTVLGSPRPTLAAGKSITINSPYGGPLYLFVEATTGGTANVQVQVSGVIKHPVLRDPNDPIQVATFKNEVASNTTNWVGLMTDALTLHSNMAQFNTALAAYSGDIAKLVYEINTYMVKDTYQLAGFKSAAAGDLSLSPGVATFCNNAGWDCTGPQHQRNVMQHVIIDDRAQCGGACAGNPYDQSFNFSPIGWGESHEIGHNLQTKRLKIYADKSDEVSNNVFPSHKQIVYHRDNPSKSPIVRGDLATKKSFDLIKSSLSKTDPSATMKTNLWSDSSYAANAAERFVFYRQLVEFARYYNPSAFPDGWDLYTLLYLLDRNVGASSANWNAVATSLGFGTYSSYPSAMDGNDFMVIASSRIIGRDMRPVFGMWGITFSAAANAQINTYSLPAADKLLFPMSDVNRYGTGVGAPITMGTTALYPAGY